MKKCLSVFAIFYIFTLAGCSKKEGKKSFAGKLEVIKNHTWYYFTEDGFEKIDLPQNAPKTVMIPWTETVRISSASSVIPSPQSAKSKPQFQAYAIVNKRGLLAFNDAEIKFFTDNSIFKFDSADELVFSSGKPVFYLFRSSFFNTNSASHFSNVHNSRPFLVEFNPSSKIFFPLVSYENLGLTNYEQVIDFFWEGKTWACAAKKSENDKVEFKYFFWEPLVPLADLTPALGQETFLFNPLTEEGYKKLNSPKLINQAPEELRELLKSIPQEFPYFVKFRDESGTSPVGYCQIGDDSTPLNATSFVAPVDGLSAAVFEDGTTFIKKYKVKDSTLGFRLPLLPSGFKYGHSAIAGKTLYVSWEETKFFNTERSGFICVNLAALPGLE